MWDDRFVLSPTDYPNTVAVIIDNQVDSHWAWRVALQRATQETMAVAYTIDYGMAMVFARSLAVVFKVKIKDKYHERLQRTEGGT
jgi:hypothetical protein